VVLVLSSSSLLIGLDAADELLDKLCDDERARRCGSGRRTPRFTTGEIVHVCVAALEAAWMKRRIIERKIRCFAAVQSSIIKGNGRRHYLKISSQRRVSDNNLAMMYYLERWFSMSSS